MKITTNLLLAGALTMLFGPIARAQMGAPLPYADLVYSNGFSGGAATTIYSSAPQVANYIINGNYTGGTNTAVWSETTNDAAFLEQNGYIDGHEGTALLPFIPVPGNVYVISSVLNLGQGLTGGSTTLQMGFTANNPGINANGTRIQDSGCGGYDWLFYRTAVDILYAGVDAANGTPSVNNLMPGDGVYTNQVVLSAINTNWIGQAFVNGVQVSTNIYYGTNSLPGVNKVPLPPIHYVGFGNNVLGNVTQISYSWWTLSMVQAPLIVTQPASGSANQGGSYTIKSTVMAPTSGGPLYYQWYDNGTLVSATTNTTITSTNIAALTLNPVTTAEAGTNYYLVVTNIYGSATSSPASLAVFSSPIIASTIPITYTNIGSTNQMFLYGGTNIGATAYYGSSPSFSVSASGALPILYYWLTNGVAVGGATNTTFAITNAQWNSPTSIVCVVSNFVGETNAAWAATYLPATQAPFPQAVLADQPVGYWRLNDTNVNGSDNGNGDNGYVCNDYQGGNNGIYTNLVLGNPGYSPTTDPNESSALFDYYSPSLAYSIGTNVDFSTETNAEFTVAFWANGSYQGTPELQNPHGGMVTKGILNQEEFTVDNNAQANLEFLVQNAADQASPATSSYKLGTDANWHFIVGVCDEANGLVSLYLDGRLLVSTNIAAGSGVYNASQVPIEIGARNSSASAFGNYQYIGYLNDVSIFNYALTASNIDHLYETVGGTVAPYFITVPPNNALVYGTTNLTIPATVLGEPPFGYYWITNGNTANILGSGASTVQAPLNAALTTTITTNSWGSQLELVVTNAYGSTNWFVNVTAPLPLPPWPYPPLPYTSPILYSNVFTSGVRQVTLNGLPAMEANVLVGGTNATWICTYTNSALPVSGTVFADGTVGTNSGCVLLPFTPEPGFIYTVDATVSAESLPNWIAIGFAEYGTQTSTAGMRFTDNPPNGYGWFYCQQSGSIASFEAGPAGASGVVASIVSGLPGPSPVTLQIVLNTVTNGAWTEIPSANGNPICTYTFTANPPINYFGIGQNGSTTQNTTNAAIQWSSLVLTAVSPNGFPPYILGAQPPATIVLNNSTVTIPVSLYGTGTFGYYWSYNSTVLAAGTDANTEPLAANLSIPTSSVGSGQLELVATNAEGSITNFVTLVSPNITATVMNNNLILGWSSALLGSQLQAQTNSLATGLGTNWVNYNPSTATNQVVIPINLSNGTVFYRLLLP